MQSTIANRQSAIWKTGFGLVRFRSPLLAESRLFSLPPGTEMVHFPGLARTRLWIQRAVSGFYPEGFPHSEIPGSKGVSPSPRLFAGNHVLLRRLAPRHPPYALSSLTIKSAQHVTTRSQKPESRSLGEELPNPEPRVPKPGVVSQIRLSSSARIQSRAERSHQLSASSPQQGAFRPLTEN